MRLLLPPRLDEKYNFGITMESFWWREIIILTRTMTLITDFVIPLIGSLKRMMDTLTRSA